jgi:hypothetical protein
MMAAVAQTPGQSPVRAGATAPRKPVHLRLWLPLTPLFWLCAPFALLLAPFVWVCVPPARRPRNPFSAALALGRVLVSLGGTIVNIEAPGSTLFIRIY